MQNAAPVVLSDSPPASSEPAAGSQSAPAPSSGQSADEPNAPIAPRQQRVPFGTLEQRLKDRARPGYRGYIFNDTPGRIERARLAGYTHILDVEGKPVSQIVGTASGGGPLHAYAMEIPEEDFRQDFLAEQAKLDAIDHSIHQGQLEAKAGDNRYVPKDGIKFQTKTEL
jgi:hypothetical protein